MFLALRGKMCFHDYHIHYLQQQLLSKSTAIRPLNLTSQHSGRKPPTVTLLDRSCTSALVFSDSLRRHHSMLIW